MPMPVNPPVDQNMNENEEALGRALKRRKMQNEELRLKNERMIQILYGGLQVSQDLSLNYWH